MKGDRPFKTRPLYILYLYAADRPRTFLELAEVGMEALLSSSVSLLKRAL